MLVLIGLGICDEKDLSLRGLEELKKCGPIFAEEYTNKIRAGSLYSLSKKIGKKIITLPRTEIEEGKTLLREAKKKRVALLVPGDPLVFTTHISLVLSAKKEGIPVRIIHSSSILSAAVSESGLHPYKFGRPVTLAYWRENYKPMSPFDAISENKSRGLHTLLLLDIDEKLGPMDAKAALGILQQMEKNSGKKLGKLLILSRAGYKDAKTSYGTQSTLLNSELGLPPSIIIVPGKLHFLEEEYLNYFQL